MFTVLEGYAIINHGEHCSEMLVFSNLTLPRSLSSEDIFGCQSAQEEDHWLTQPRQQGFPSLTPTCTNAAVVPPHQSLLQHPVIFLCPMETPASHPCFQCPSRRAHLVLQGHVCWSVVQPCVRPFHPVRSTCLSQRSPPLIRGVFFACKEHWINKAVAKGNSLITTITAF